MGVHVIFRVGTSRHLATACIMTAAGFRTLPGLHTYLSLTKMKYYVMSPLSL